MTASTRGYYAVIRLNGEPVIVTSGDPTETYASVENKAREFIIWITGDGFRTDGVLSKRCQERLNTLEILRGYTVVKRYPDAWNEYMRIIGQQ